MTDMKKYIEAFDEVHASEKTEKEILDMTSAYRYSAPGTKRTTAVIAAICAALILAAAVYAAGSHFGILDFAKNHPEQISEDAAQLIDTDIEQQPTAPDGDVFFSSRVLEALCDGETVTVVYEVSEKEAGNYLFIPTDASPDDSMSMWGYDSSLTFAEYAAGKGLTIAAVGGGIANGDELGIAAQGLDFRSVADGIMDVYVRCSAENAADGGRVVCTATAVVAGKVSRSEVEFTLQNRAGSVDTVYAPAAAQNGAFIVTRVEVTQTELGTYADIFYADTQNLGDALYLSLLDADGNYLPILEGTGVKPLDDGSFTTRFVLNPIDFGKTVTVQGENLYDGSVFGTVTLEKIG